MMNGSNYSLSDIAAATGSNNRANDMWGGDGFSLIWLVLIFAIFGWGGFGGWGGGFGGNGANGAGFQDGPHVQISMRVLLLTIFRTVSEVFSRASVTAHMLSTIPCRVVSMV